MTSFASTINTDASVPRPEAAPLAVPPAMHGPHEWRIPTHGVLFEGECVRVGWPEEDEFDAITALRNRPEMRGNFLDTRALDPARNREWLRHGMRRPYEAVLAIRMKHDDAFVGAIGWSHGDPLERSMELGRVMVDARKAIAHRASLPAGYAGVALDAGKGARDFGFSMLGLNVIRMQIIDGNRLSLSAACTGGGRIVGTEMAKRPDGSELKLIRLECSRDDWHRVRQQEAEAAAYSMDASPTEVRA